MSVLSPKRVILFVAIFLLGTAAFANHPSPRLQPRMAFDEQNGVGVLFGGRGLADPAIGLTVATDETWFWVQNQWSQQFPQHRPGGRSEHGMVYDSQRQRIVVFGGRRESTELRARHLYYNDTWIWQNNDWQQLETANAPGGREMFGMAYDRDRDRIVLFGGYDNPDGRTREPLKDTWEFDGNNWVQVSTNGPEVAKPVLVYDEARDETLMLGIDDEFETLMYRWNADSDTWEQITGTLPTCINEGTMAYQRHNERVLAVGGVCTTETPTVDETWEWDGSTWTKLTTNGTTRYVGAASAYDTTRGRFVRFGGTAAFSASPDSSTHVYRDLEWAFARVDSSPSPRSLPAFRRDPVRNSLFLLGGLFEFAQGTTIFYINDFWSFTNGQWNRFSDIGVPQQCQAPLSAFDTDRSVLVVFCGDGRITEFDGSEWKSFSGLEDVPDSRRFAGFVYDQTLKKSVLFGGFDDVFNYRDDTWTWDGVKWTEVDTDDEPENRAQMAMWYDPLAKKTILYSGVGRPDIEDKVKRFADMWSFDGGNWTRMNETVAPGIRFGSMTAVHPTTGKVTLFGGLRATVSEDGKTIDQFYDDDMWIWDGAANTWTEVATPEFGPSKRQNGGFDYDPQTGKLVLTAGFAGNFYFSDTWMWDGDSWEPLPDFVTNRRRRAARR